MQRIIAKNVFLTYSQMVGIGCSHIELLITYVLGTTLIFVAYLTILWTFLWVPLLAIQYTCEYSFHEYKREL